MKTVNGQFEATALSEVTSKNKETNKNQMKICTW